MKIWTLVHFSFYLLIVCSQSHPHNFHRVRDDVKIEWDSITSLGNVTSNTTFVKRDLGFAGQIGPYVLLSYGDTLWADGNLSCEPFRGMTSNSIALSTHDPLLVVDTDLNAAGYPNPGISVRPDWGEDPATWAVGITNAVETGPNQGVIFTLLNHRPDGNQTIKGAGLATVTLSSDFPPVVHTTRTAPFLWDGSCEPWYGDVGALRTPTHIYAYGHMPGSQHIYLARAPLSQALSLPAYEYWHGPQRGWSPARLTAPTTGPAASVLWNVNQGQVVYSPHFRRYLFVYCDNFWSSTVVLKHAPAPEGPWSDPVDVLRVPPLQQGGTIYAAAPQTQFDPSGKTLVVAFTNHPNTVQAVRIVFK